MEMTVRKKSKKLANVRQRKNKSNIGKLSNPFKWFYNTLLKLVLQYSKGYEF